MAENNDDSGYRESYLDDDLFGTNANNEADYYDDLALLEPVFNYVNGDEFTMFPPPPNLVESPSVMFQLPEDLDGNGNAAKNHNEPLDYKEMFSRGERDATGAPSPAQQPKPAAPAQQPQPAAPAQQYALTLPQIDPSLQGEGIKDEIKDEIVVGEHIKDQIIVAGSESPNPATPAPQGYSGQLQDHPANLDSFFGIQDQDFLDLNLQLPQDQPQYPLNPLAGQDNKTHHLYSMPVLPHPPSHGQLGTYSNMHGQQQQQHQQHQQQEFPAQGLYGNHYGHQFPTPPPLNMYQPQNASPNPYQPRQLKEAEQSPQPQVKIHHKRGRKGDANNDPSQIYAKPGPLEPWGSDMNNPKERLFHYHRRTAELRSGIMLTKDQIVAFLLGNGHPNRAGRRLTLWIQNTAAQSNDRYANGSASSKCRYKDCPGRQNTILKGFYRVAFDEFSDQTGITHDPMHNAFYMHLHCFENLFDLGFLIHHGARNLRFQIRADTREFAHESRNPASINRDHDRMVDTYNEWANGHRVRADAIYRRLLTTTTAQEQWYTGLNPPPENIPAHQQRLGYALTLKHLESEHKARAQARNKRGGVHIGVHQGDLAKLERLKKQQRDVNRAVGENEGDQWQQPGGGSAQPTTGKKRAADEPDDYPGTRASKRNKQAHTYSLVNDFSVPNPQPQVSDIAPVAPQGRGRKRGGDDDDDDDDDDNGDAANSPPFNESSAAARKRSKQTHNYSNPLLRPPPNLPPPPFFQRNPSRSETAGPEPHGAPEQQQPQRPMARPRAPRTRQRSREIEHNILDQLHQQPHLTRSSAHAIQSRLGDEPAHLQDQILAAVPEEYVELVSPPPPPQPQQQQQQQLGDTLPPVVFPDQLERRVAGLGRAQRRGVLGAVEREESKAKVLGSKQRKVQSL
jgi:hypothetical protein